MTEYQSVIVRLSGRTQNDEDTVTDILNERDRMGWSFHSSTALAQGKLLLVFTRST
jgi:hypothetical protein